jgi:hypothetical protein
MVAVLSCIGVMPTQSSAAQLVMTATFDLTLESGPDVLGLNGASLSLAGTWDSVQTYIDRFGLPEADSLSDSLLITGASLASTNGTYIEPAGLGFYPTFEGQLFAGGPADGHMVHNINGTSFEIRNLLAEQSGINIGDTIDPSHFSTTLQTAFPVFSFSIAADGSTYSRLNLQVTASIVPEPSSLILAAFGLIGLVVYGWRRKR